MESYLESLLSQKSYNKSHNIALDFDGVIAKKPRDTSIKVFETFDRLLGKCKLVGIMYRLLYEPLSLNGRKPNEEFIKALNGRPVHILTTNSEHVKENIRKYAENAGLSVKEVYALPPGKREEREKYGWINAKLQELIPVIYVTDDSKVSEYINGRQPQINIVHLQNGQNASTNNPKIGYFKYLI